jgi:uncharacterized membrane protein YeaQ/YmgE (transglycosylase-associated protein family)
VPGRTPGGTVGALIVGVLGVWILDLLDVDSDLSWIGSLLVAIVGAVIILYVIRAP